MSSGRPAWRRRFTHSSCNTCVLTAPDRSRHSSSTTDLARSCFSPAAVSCAYIRMFVSTKYLSLMDLVTGGGRRPPEIEPLAEPRQRPALRLVERFPFANQGFEPLRKERADRPALLGGENTGLAKQVGVEFECHIGF